MVGDEAAPLRSMLELNHPIDEGKSEISKIIKLLRYCKGLG